MADIAAEAKMDDRERKKREIRERLEAQLSSSKKKKGFMTPERKKRLRQLLRRNAAEEVKRQQELKEKERQRVITERTGEPTSLNDLSNDQLMQVCKDYHNRIYKLNEDKWDLELVTCVKEYEINDLQSRVNDMRGKFIIPPLKKVSKYQTQLEKMRQWTYKLAKMDMRGALKSVRKEIELDDKRKKVETRPEWAEVKAAKQKEVSEVKEEPEEAGAEEEEEE